MSVQEIYSNVAAACRYLLPVLAISIILHGGTNAQSIQDPTEYVTYIGDRYTELSIDFYKYMSAVAHSHNARKIEKKRQHLLETSWDTYTKVRTMPTFRGNRTLRDSTAAYLKISHRVLKEDYEKILDLEVVADRSYDDMEAYILAQRVARNKLDVANVRMLAEQKKFAAAHNLQLVFREDELYARMKMANDVLSYLNQVYLVFFRCHKQEIYLLDALADKDEDAILQNRKMLLDHVASGMRQLETLGSFNGDATLTDACSRLNEFYIDESGDVASMLRYIQEEQEFERQKIYFDQLPTDERNKVSVDIYNAAVRKLNDEAIGFNAANQRLFELRSSLTDQWRSAFEQFLHNHIPVF